MLQLFSLLLLASPVWPASIVISFDDALRQAVERAPSLAARQAQLEAAQQDAARAAQLPDPRLKLGIANWPVTGADAFSFGADFMTMKQIGVMQDFPARAKLRARQQVADSGVAQAESLSVAERAVIRQSAAQAWIALRAAEDEAAALRAMREPAQIAVDTSKARLAGGKGSAADALAARAASLHLESRIDAAQADVEAARAGLARWLGSVSTEVEATGATPDLAILPISETMLLNSIDRLAPLLPWDSRNAVAEAGVDAAIAEKRPDWSLGVTYGQRDRAPTGSARSDMLMLEFSIGLPLFTGNRQDRDLAARRAEREAVAADYQEARRAQLEALQRQLAEWHGLQRQITRHTEEALPLAHDRSQTALAAYGAGADLQPWIEARRDEIEIHVEHARLVRDLGRAWAQLAYLLPDQESVP
jgi:outer membrane protein TolC